MSDKHKRWIGIGVGFLGGIYLLEKMFPCQTCRERKASLIDWINHLFEKKEGCMS
jgi:hypothetical protein